MIRTTRRDPKQEQDQKENEEGDHVVGLSYPQRQLVAQTISPPHLDTTPPLCLRDKLEISLSLSLRPHFMLALRSLTGDLSFFDEEREILVADGILSFFGVVVVVNLHLR